MTEKLYSKYRTRGSLQWREMVSRDVRHFNADQQGRYDLVIRALGDISGKTILDLGGGDGALAYCLYKQGAQVIVVDNEPDGIRFGKENFASKAAKAEFVLGSVYEVPFPDNHFDHVVCSEVVEHLLTPERAVGEAYRVVKNDGLFVMTTPYRLLEVPRDSDDLREYFPSEVKALLKQFSHIEIKLTHHIFWFGLFTYAFRKCSNRQFGRWFINALTLWFGYNPFTIEYPKPGKFDRFMQIIAVAKK